MKENVMESKNLTKLIGEQIGKIPVFVAEPCGDGQVKFWCPFCYKHHFHGDCNDGDWEGHRVSHCKFDDSPLDKTGYYIVTAKRANRLERFYGKRP